MTERIEEKQEEGEDLKSNVSYIYIYIYIFVK